MSAASSALAEPADSPRAPKPFSRFERLLATRYLRARRQEGFISVIAVISFLGIMLGVATLIVVLSVMNGFRKELIGKILGVNGHVFLQAMDRPFTDWAELSARVAGVPGVTLVVPMVEGQALASSPYQANGVLVRGVRGSDLARVPQISANIRQGTLDGFDEANGVVIGRRLADALAVRAGETLTLVSPRGAQTPFGVAPRIKSYTVQAVYEVGMTEIDTIFVYMPIEEAQAYFNREGDATTIEIFTAEPDRVAETRAAIDRAISDRPTLISDWRERNRTFFGALEVERNVMFLILTLIVLIAALNIVSGLFMLVKDKGAAIAILRTMGATRGAIMRVFLMTGAAIGVVGTLAGFGLGLALALNAESIRATLGRLTNTNLFPSELYFLSRLPSVVEPREVATVVLLALGLSLLATLYPSWRASRVDPVEALRYE